MRKTISDLINAWYASTDEVNRLGRDMVSAQRFVRADAGEALSDLLAYFEKPWHWNAEHAWWVANEWPDDAATWEQGEDDEWETSEK